MARAPSTFRQRDVTAAIKAARDAGIAVAQVKIQKDGTITIISGVSAEPSPLVNEWDEVLENHADR